MSFRRSHDSACEESTWFERMGMDGKGGVWLKVVSRRMDCRHCMGGAIVLRMFRRRKASTLSRAKLVVIEAMSTEDGAVTRAWYPLG